MKKLFVMRNHDFQKIRNSIVNFHETKILSREIYRNGSEFSLAIFRISKKLFIEVDHNGKVFLKNYNKRIFRITGEVGVLWYQYAISLFYDQFDNEIKEEKRKSEYKNWIESRINYQSSTL